jgi:hypothetical protein
MTITKITNGYLTTYFYSGVKKYEQFIDLDDPDGFRWWREYDENGNEIYYKDSDGFECFGDDHPNNPAKQS